MIGDIKMANNALEEGTDNQYRWETGYEKTWEAITEDQDGLMEVSVQEMIQRAKRKRLLDKSGAKTKLGMMRHFFILLDMSQNMKNQDLKPTRLLCLTKLLKNFIDEFFHLNPISQMGLIVTRNKRAELISELAGNARQHVSNVEKLAASDTTGHNCQGEPSLQNSLELAIQTLRHMPGHASRELLFLVGSLTTCDPGDITTTIATCKALHIRCSVISLAAEVRIYRELANATGGTFNVILDDVHLRDLLSSQLEPPPSALGAEPTLIKMGFPCGGGGGGADTSGSAGAAGQSPAQQTQAGLSLCMCHLDTATGCKLSTSGFNCPQCSAKYCELPVECKCCGLTLVSAPHLARSYHHLFPLPVFKEVLKKESQETNCGACVREFKEGRDSLLYQCPDCQTVFCCDCDIFFHETLHSCPVCVGAPQKAMSKSTNGKV